MRRSALQTFFRRSIMAALPLALGVPAEATTPACQSSFVVPAPRDDGGVFNADGGIDTAECNHICGGYGYWCEPAPADAGAGAIVCHYNHCTATCGRLTDGVAVTDSDGGGGVVGRYFAHAARLEAASVLAFRRLARELGLHGAPPSLVARAIASARDEVRHARLVGRLAVAFGGRRRGIARTTLTTRPLDEIAIENAVEGCVRETFGALVASWQALTARAPEVRRTMRLVAADERRHAELAWSVARWAEPRLSRAARRRLHIARREALARLEADVAVAPPRALVAVAGLPPVPAARRLLADVSALAT